MDGLYESGNVTNINNRIVNKKVKSIEIVKVYDGSDSVHRITKTLG